jgi:hypothetical protein
MMWWDPRLYGLVLCLGLLARASFRGALNQLDGEYGGWGGSVLFWIPLAGIVCLGASLLAPAAKRWLRRRGLGR